MEVTNTGARAGAAVVQLYVGDPEASVKRPEKELKAFAKVRLNPGEKRRVALTLTARDFAYFDVARQCWRVEAGRFDLLCGFSAAEICCRAAIVANSDLDLPV